MNALPPIPDGFRLVDAAEMPWTPAIPKGDLGDPPATGLPPIPPGFKLIDGSALPPIPDGFRLADDGGSNFFSEAGKGIVRGAGTFAGSMLQGGAALDPAEAFRRDIDKYRADLLRVPTMRPEELDAFRKRLDGENTVTRWFIGGTIDQIQSGAVTPEDIAAIKPPAPIVERELYKAGTSLSEAAQREFPVAPGWEGGLTATLSEGFGSLLAGFGTAVVGGPAVAGAGFTAAGAGEAAQRAVEFDKAEKAAGRPGLSEEQIATAAVLGVGPGATDLIPIETMMGALRVPAPFRRPLARAVARIGGQAFIEGVQEGGQQYLQNLIAQEVYNPDQDLGEGVLPNVGAGAGVGGIAQTLLELIPGRSRGTSAQPQPQPQPAPVAAQPAPAGVPEGAVPAETILPPVEEEDTPEIPAASAPEAAAGVPAVPALPGPAPIPAPPAAAPAPTTVDARTDAYRKELEAAGVSGVALEKLVTAFRTTISREAPDAAPNDALPTPGAGADAGPAAADGGGVEAAPEGSEAGAPVPGEGGPDQAASVVAPLDADRTADGGNASAVVAAAQAQGTQPEAVTPPAPSTAGADAAAPLGTKAAPAIVETADDLAAATAVPRPEPTEAQKEAGNYAKTHVKVQGFDIAIENPKGSIRSGKDRNGETWSVKMPIAYGYIKRTEGADGDQVDVYVGERPQVSKVFVVDQVDADTKAFDEHKVFMGVPTHQAVRAIYSRAFSDGRGPDRLGAITPMTIEEFKAWLRDGDMKKPAAQTLKPEQPEDTDPPKRPAEPPVSGDRRQGETTLKATRGGIASEIEKPAAVQQTEHPGLVVKSLQTGRTEVIQPPGTVPPRSTGPAAKKRPSLAQLTDYAKAVVQDTEAVDRVTLVGSVAATGEGNDIDLLYDLNIRDLPRDGERAAERVQEVVEAPGNSALDAGGNYDSFFKVGDRYFHLATGAGSAIVENTSYAKDQAGRPTKVLADRPGAAGTQSAAERGEAQQKALADAPTWAEVLTAAPKVNGRPDTDFIFRLMRDIAGGATKFTDLSAEDRGALLKAVREETAKVEAPRPKSTNKLFTDAGADAARARIRAKLRNQVASGIDPELLADGAYLTGYHIEKGIRSFLAASRAVAEDLGVAISEIRPYLRSWYNGARDMMEDAGLSVTGMDGPDEVKAALVGLEASNVDAQPSASGGTQASEPEAGGDLAAGQSGRAGSDGAMAAGPAEDGEGAGGRRAPGDRGASVDQPGAGSGDRVPEGGNAADGRPRAGGSRVADAGTGDGGRDHSPAVRPNYFIADPESLIGGGPKARFARNRAAIEAYRGVTEEGRDPSQAELDSMAAYIGWGSFGQELFQGSWERPRPKSGWEAEDTWLREHLGQKEWESAQRSIINAHYTDPPTVAAMWGMVRRMGFTGGRVLEPSIGIGNFFGLMPRDLMGASDLTGIELDSLTGGMAKILYPHANVQIKGYQDSKTPDNFYDLVIGNWPFAADGPADRRYDKLSPSLHDYFFVKALDQVRPGGIVIGITSAGTMDKVGKSVRIDLAKKAELIGAYRLPSGAFEKYAGTSVVTDIVVLRKREAPEAGAAVGWIEAVEIDTPTGEKVRVNEYFRDHPENVLGQLNWGHGTTSGRPGMIVDRPADMMDRLRALPDRLPEGIFLPRTRGKEPRFITNNSQDRDGSIVVSNGNLYVVQGERQVLLEDLVKYRVKSARQTEAIEAQIIQLVDMRRAYGRLIDAERDGAPNTESFRSDLRRQYEAFRASYGPIIDSDGIKVFKRVKDPADATLLALETSDGKPSRILTEATTRSKKALTNPTVRDAFVMTRNESRVINLDRVAEISGRSVATVERELLDARAIFRTPGGGFEVADVYLSGNVRRKMREAEEARARGEDMDVSIEALRAATPADIPYFQIEAKLGATWVANERYRDFIAHLLSISEEQANDGIAIRFAAGSWRVHFTDTNLNRRPEATAQWGTPDIRFERLIRSAMNNQTITIRRKDSDGKEYVDEKASALANEKARLIREEFSSWAWRDAERRIALERSYNEVMNAIAIPQFDGGFLEFTGMTLRRGNDAFSLRKHQVDAIWRGIVNGRGIFAHEVGTGKTYTIGGIAVESRRYGLARKPLILAHNANSRQVADGIREMYPGAQVLYVDNMAPDVIQTNLRRIANEEWDAVVMPHSLIDRLTLKKETLEEIAREEIAALEDEAIAAAADDGIDLTPEMMTEEGIKKVRSVTAKQLVHQRNRIIAKIDEMSKRASREGAIPFEELGVDMMMVDEAHEFKKPPIATKMQLKGLNKQTSQRSISLSFLAGYVKKMNGGKGVHLFTGTPITNTLTEIFNMMRYTMDDQMALDGIKDWDAWFNTFADATSDIELTPTGEYEPVTRLAAFVNVAELRRMAGQFMDIVFADDMPEFKPRETLSGKTLASPDLSAEERADLIDGRSENPIGRPYKRIINDVGPLGAEQRQVLDLLIGRAKRFRSWTKKQRRDAMLAGLPEMPIRVESDATQASLDVRLYDPEASDDPQSKVNRAVRNVLELYGQSAEGTQVIFMESGFSDAAVSTRKDAQGNVIKTKKMRFNLAKDIVSKLVAGGIPEEQIAIVDGSTSKQKRKDIADAMNASRIRVVIGSSDTLGVGVNMQENLRAMHHLDAPWMPGELEQRNGRGWRQGNKWNTVLEIRYITDKLDGRRWMVLSVKDRFIKAFMKANDQVRIIDGDAVSEDDGVDAMGLAETLSEAAGDPRLLIVNKLKGDVEKLERRERLHSFGVADAKDRAQRLRADISAKRDYVKRLDEAIAGWKAAADNPFSATINGNVYSERAKADDAIVDAARRLAKGDKKTIGVIRGFTLTADWSALLQKEPRYEITLGSYIASVKPSLASIEGMARNLESNRTKAVADIEDMQASIGRLDAASRQPFQQEGVLTNKRQQLRDVQADLAANPVPPPPWLRFGAPIDTVVHVDGSPHTVIGHRWTDDDYVVLTEGGQFSYRQVTDEVGMPLYEPRAFERPVQSKELPASSEPPPRSQSLGSTATPPPGGVSVSRLRIEASRRQVLERALSAIVRRIAGKDVSISFEDRIAAAGAGDAAYQADMARFEKEGGSLSETAGGEARIYSNGEALVRLALADPLFEPTSSAYHEAYHVAEATLMADAEFAAVRDGAGMPMIELAARQLGIPESDAALLPGYEIRAIAFERYARARDGGASVAEAFGAPASALSRFFERLRRLLAEVKRLLGRQGITRVEDIFEAVYRGDMAGRERGYREITSGEAQSLGSVVPHPDELGPFSRGGAEARRDAMTRAIEFQPIDRAIRLPFDIFGGLNQKGEWKPGLWLADKAKTAITSARFSDEGRFAWMNPLMHRVRAGLVDRYGLDDEYVARERRRVLEERAMLADVPEIMRTLAAADVGPAEARVLHDILTGERVADDQWAMIAEPIRNAVDAFGQEAVELGLLSAEAYERNKGSYVHRVYLKHEAEQTGLARWVGQMMTSRRKRIIGNEFKGRGLWQQVDVTKLVAEGEDPPPNGARFNVYDRVAASGRVTKRVYVRSGAAAPEGFVSRGQWEVRGRRGGQIVLWRDFTKPERERMGEITDARYTIAKTYMMMAHDLAVGRFYRDIAANADWTTDEEPRAGLWKEASEYSRFWTDPTIEWVLVPTTKIPKSQTAKYGALAGKFVRAEIWRDIHEIEILNRSGVWSALLTQWKLNKALALDTPIPTPSGWTTMGAIRVGDQVFDETGAVCLVEEVKDIAYGRPCYEVAFSDGTKIVADEEHFWFTIKRNTSRGGVRTTGDILRTLYANHRGDANHSIPVSGPLALPEAALPLPPYALGLWLGDGDTDKARLTIGGACVAEVEQHLSSVGVFCGTQVRDKRSSATSFTIDTKPVRKGRAPNHFKDGLRSLGVLGEKRIPEVYLRASISQRRDLLQGLIDSDGWVTERGTCGFATSAPPLRDGVLELMRSLGFKPTTSEFVSLSGATAWRIHFQAYADMPIARLSAKACRLRSAPGSRQRSRTRQIVAVTPVPSVPVRCIAVSSKSHLYLAGTGMVPTHNTARSPVVHMNNVISNFALMDMSGVGTLDLVKAIRSMATGDETYRQAADLGAFGADMATQEIRRNVLKPILEEIERDMAGVREGRLLARFGLLGKIAEGIWSKAKAVDRKMLDLYRLEDEVFRLALFVRRRAQGIDPQAAADEAREQFIDYDIRAPWVNAARRTVLPFIAYTYRAIPIVARTVMTRPWKLAKYAAVAYAANALSYLIFPGDEDRERRSLREEEQGTTWIGAPRMIRMPFGDMHGNPVFLDIRRWIPAGDVFDTSQGHDALGFVPSWLQLGGPLMLGMEIAFNKQAFTGEPITNDLTDDPWDRAAKIGDWAWKGWVPSAAWVPGSWYWTKIGNAITGARDWSGRPYDVGTAVASSLGIKFKPQDVEQGFTFWGFEFDRIERELKMEMGQIARDRARGLLSQGQFERARAKILDKLGTLNERRRDTFVGAGD